MRCKKVLDSWHPSENPHLKVGEVIEISDPMQLIRDGVVVPVNAQGFVVEWLETISCPVCSFTAKEPNELIEHTKEAHDGNH